MARLNWTPIALQWLEAIHEYIAADNLTAANRVIDGIVSKVGMLIPHPLAGSRLRVVPEGEIRVLIHGHYRIPYLYRTEADSIETLGVFHGAMDMDRYLQ